MRTVIRIDRDYLADDDGSLSGKTWAGKVIDESPQPERVRWRLKDDDGNVYFGGWLEDAGAKIPDSADPWLFLVEWGAAYAGCTRVEEKRDGEWVAVIG